MSTDLEDIEGSLDEPAFWCWFCHEPQLSIDYLGDCGGCGRGRWQTLLEIARSEGDLEIFTKPSSHPKGKLIETVTARSKHSGLAVYLLHVFLERFHRKQQAVSEAPIHVSGDQLVHMIYSNFYERGLDAGFFWCKELHLHRPRRVCDLVYAMVDADLLKTQPGDRPEDFDRALLAVYWFENRRRWERVMSWRRWPLSSRWVRWNLQRWRQMDAKLTGVTPQMIEADWQELVASAAKLKADPGSLTRG